MTAPEWRDCADPDELAAAVAAGVEVRWEDDRGEWVKQANEFVTLAAYFRRWLSGPYPIKFRVPTSWSWRPEPPATDDLAARARRHADTHPESRELIEELLGTGWVALTEYVPGDVVTDLDGGRQVCTLPTAPPTPPWPGAVLSGLTDEDGEPTWLAQAGHVRGEQVRACASVPWLPNTSYGEDEWVEVRAPRAVPATERVPVLDAITHRRQVTHPSAPFEAEAVMWVEGELAVCEYGGPAQPVAPDGTVEVLKDGDR